MKPVFAVGSENPIKVNCAAAAVAAYWPAARVIGSATDSGVSAQPISDQEMFAGARNRARQALRQHADADFGIGLEGGVLDDEHGMWAYAWAVIVDRADTMGVGQTGKFLLPEGVARLVRGGMELGTADDLFFGRSNSKQHEGAIGILSLGHITRAALYGPAVTFALLRFVNEEVYAR